MAVEAAQWARAWYDAEMVFMGPWWIIEATSLAGSV